MPKIDVNEKLFFQALGRKLDKAQLRPLLVYAKAELDDWPEGGGPLRIELNDTNRPDLWSTMGLARQLSVVLKGKAPAYPFFSRAGAAAETRERRVVVGAGLKEIRPYIASFVAEGESVTEEMLKDIIQSQEKLCGIYGRKRKTIAMGVSRADLITWPVHYDAADPDKTSFVPLDFTAPMSMREILRAHPKGREFGDIVSGYNRFPLLSDANGDVLTFPPVINSAAIGGVKVGDSRLFVDLTGPDMDSILTACAIVACDFADMGFTILPVTVEYPYETPAGRRVVTPVYFQKPVSFEIDAARKRLGDSFTTEEAANCIRKMGSRVEISGTRLTVFPPEYRNDFMHAVDAIEEIMIGRGMDSFVPVMPQEFTVGRITAAEEYNRRVRELMVGLGYQEMIYNYLGSKRDIVERMGIPEDDVIEIANPMTESYQMVRNSILPNLLASESISASAAFPHRIFEVGKVVVKDSEDNQGCRTVNTLGMLWADKDVGFNEVDAHLLGLCYYLSVEPTLVPVEDPRFIPGRAARIVVRGRQAGILGELHPRVLEAWGIAMPCAAAEIHLDGMRTFAES